MEFDEAAQHSRVIPPERVASLVTCLNKVPDFSWLLTGPHTDIPRLQGDIIRDFPVAFVDHKGNPICKRTTVLLLNNTCDLQPNRSDCVVVAPVMDFKKFSSFAIEKRGVESSRNYLKDVKSNKVFEILWLPSFGAYEQGAVVFLDRIGATAMACFDSALQNNSRVASFSQNGFYFLLLKITKHLARPESEEVSREDIQEQV